MPEKKLSAQQLQEAQKIAEEILEKIPLEIIRFYFGKDFPEKLGQICLACEIYDLKKIENIALQLGRVFFGLLPPQKLLERLKTEAELPPISASRLFDEINTQIFTPLKNGLEKLYNQYNYNKEERSKEEKEEIMIKSQKPKEEEIPPQKATDIYREPIE